MSDNLTLIEMPWIAVTTHSATSGESFQAVATQAAARRYGGTFPLMVFHPEGAPSTEVLSLVLAAPDLLMALKSLLSAFHAYGNNPDALSRAQWDRAAYAAHNALAKASGKSPVEPGSASLSGAEFGAKK